jgi:homoserine O-succinyltransferase
MAEAGLTDATPLFGAPAPALRFALVNAMGDAALAVTEQRFARLLRAAFADREVDLRCFTPPEIARGEMAAARIARHYGGLDELRASAPDAVIFSGAEPLFADLRQEVFWASLAGLFDWVRAAGIPALFSCLAAHAAALHFGGVRRRRLAQKLSGVFAQAVAADHCLTRGLPADFAMIHSRWNDLPETALTAAGFCVLTRGGAGVDAFVAPDERLLFLQGHPEYELGVLDGEYRRDLRRFEHGVVGSAPSPPDLGQANAENLAAGQVFSHRLLRNLLSVRDEAAA